MSDEPSAAVCAPPTPIPRTPRSALASAGTPMMPPLSPRSTQKRTPASVLADTPVNTTPPRKATAAPVISATSRLSPADEAAEPADHSPMPRRPSADRKASTTTAATAKNTTTGAMPAAKPTREKKATTAPVVAQKEPLATAAPATAETKPRTSSAALISELRRLSSSRRRSGSGEESEPSPFSSSPSPTSTVTPRPEPKSAVTTTTTTTTTPSVVVEAMPTTPRARTATPGATKTPTVTPVKVPVSPRATATAAKTQPLPPPSSSPAVSTPAVVEKTPAGRAVKTSEASSATPASPTAITTPTATVPAVPVVDRRVGIQLKLEEASEERRRARLVYDACQEAVQLRKDFRESTLALLAQSGSSSEAATNRFLTREAAKGLAPVDLDALVAALGPAPGGAASRATTPRTAASITRAGSTPLRGTSPTTPVRAVTVTGTETGTGTPTATAPTALTAPVLSQPRPAPAEHAAKTAAPTTVSPLPPSSVSAVSTMTASSTPTPTPRVMASLPPLTPRAMGGASASTPGDAALAPKTPTTAARSLPTNTASHNNNSVSVLSAVTPCERSVASVPSTPRAGSVMGNDADAIAAQRELAAVRRDKERADRDLTRANTKLSELQEKLTQEKETHSAARKEASTKLNEAVNEAKQLQKDLRDGQRREERLQKELDKSAEATEKLKQQMQILKEKASVENSGVLTPGTRTPRAMSVSTTSGNNNNNNNIASGNAMELRALERKMESLEKDKKRAEEALEKMTQRQTDASTELRTTKQELQKLTTEAAKEKAALQAEIKQQSRDVAKLERTLQQRADEVEALKTKAATAANGVDNNSSNATSATPSKPSKTETAAEPTDAQVEQVKALEADLRKAQRELRQANDRVKQLEAQVSTSAAARETDRETARASQQGVQARLNTAEKALQESTAQHEAAQRTLREKLQAVEKERDALHGVAQDTADEATKLAEQLEKAEKSVAQLQNERVKQREASLVEAESEVTLWKQKHAAQLEKVRELEEAVCELQRHAEQVEEEAKTLQAALDAAEQDREELANRYASQSKRLLAQQKSPSQKAETKSDESHLAAMSALEASLHQSEAARTAAEQALAAKAEEATALAEALDALRRTRASVEAPEELTESLTKRVKKAEAALKVAQRENTEIKAVNDKVFLHLSKLEAQVAVTSASPSRAASGSPGRHSTTSASAAQGEPAVVLSQHTRELMESQLAHEKASRRQLEQELRRLQAKLRRMEKGEAVSPAVSPNTSVVMPSSTKDASVVEAPATTTRATTATATRTSTPARRDRHKDVPTSALAHQWNRGYFTPLAALSPAKEAPRSPTVSQGQQSGQAATPVTLELEWPNEGEAARTSAAQPDTTSQQQPRSSTWRPSQAFEEEEAELQRQQFADDHDQHHPHHALGQPQAPFSDRYTPVSVTGQSFSAGTLTSLAGGAGAVRAARRPSRARSPQAAHCLDTRFFDPTATSTAGLPSGEDGTEDLMHLPAAPQVHNPSGHDPASLSTPTRQRSLSFAAVMGAGPREPSRAVSPSMSLASAAMARSARYATRPSPVGLVFSSTAQRLLVSGHGRRVERLLLQTTMGGSPSPPRKHADSASIISTSAVGSMSHSLYAARMDAEGQHWERNTFAFTVRVGDLRAQSSLTGGDAVLDPLDVLVGFSDRYMPLEGFGNGRNSLRYSGCYYLHVGSGTLYAPSQGARSAPYSGWSTTATQARAVCTPPSPSLAAMGGSGASPRYGTPLAAQLGDEITCVLHVRERLIRFEWNGIDCGVAFENVAIHPSLYPSVEMNCSGGFVELL